MVFGELFVFFFGWDAWQRDLTADIGVDTILTDYSLNCFSA